MDLPQHSGKDTTWEPRYDASYSECASDTRLCQNGLCVPITESCPKQFEIDENQILKILVIGTVIFLFMFVLYCFHRHAQRRRERNTNANQNIVNDGDHVSLSLPPPSYNDVISSDLYPPTPQRQHSTSIPSHEEPLTPPPNYDTALRILARSQENLHSAKNELPIIRRSVSSDIHPSSPNDTSRLRSNFGYQRMFSFSEDRPSC